MKQVLFVLLMAAACTVNAQYNSLENNGGSIRTGVAYVHDFPGMHGTAEYAQYSFPLNEWLQGGMGVKHLQTSGYPRTSTVQEYTKANTIDFELLLVPVHTENAALRVGLGYTFSFYNIRRSYPVYTAHDNGAATVAYPVADSKGNVHGTSLVAEYEYNFGNTVSGGVKMELAKAYGYVVIGGPFVAIKL
jgi:hypothetical protein